MLFLKLVSKVHVNFQAFKKALKKLSKISKYFFKSVNKTPFNSQNIQGNSKKFAPKKSPTGNSIMNKKVTKKLNYTNINY
jgi:hypothetical protein